MSVDGYACLRRQDLLQVEPAPRIVREFSNILDYPAHLTLSEFEVQYFQAMNNTLSYSYANVMAMWPGNCGLQKLYLYFCSAPWPYRGVEYVQQII